MLDCVSNCLHLFRYQKVISVWLTLYKSITLYAWPIQRHTTIIRKEFVSCSKFVFAFQSQMSRMMSDVCSLMAAERQHRQDLEQAELEKWELMELLRGLQEDCRLTTTEGSRKSTNFRPLA